MNPFWSLPVPPLIHTCLWFDTEAEAAAEFYASVFPRSQVTAITRYGPAMPMPEGLALTVELLLDGTRLTLLNGGPGHPHTLAASLVVTVHTQAELERYMDRLSAAPEAEQCGWLKDRYGVSWQLVPEPLMQRLKGPDGAAKQRMMAALMGMKRLHLPSLLAAYDGTR